MTGDFEICILLKEEKRQVPFLFSNSSSIARAVIH